MSPRERQAPFNGGAPIGVLVAGGQVSAGASVTAALLARQAQSVGMRVLLVGPAPRAERLAGLFGVPWTAPTAAPLPLDHAIHLATTVAMASGHDLIVSVPAPTAESLTDRIDELAAQASPLHAVILASEARGSVASAFAVLKLVRTHQPRCSVTVAPRGRTELAALREAAKKWLNLPLRSAVPLPFDPTLPVALGAGIPFAEAVADTALTSAAGALWSALAPSAPLGALA